MSDHGAEKMYVSFGDAYDLNEQTLAFRWRLSRRSSRVGSWYKVAMELSDEQFNNTNFIRQIVLVVLFRMLWIIAWCVYHTTQTHTRCIPYSIYELSWMWYFVDAYTSGICVRLSADARQKQPCSTSNDLLIVQA